MTVATTHIGKATPRVDGRAKVTGAARYAADVNVPDLVYGCAVSSAIARGRIKRIDARDALAVDGVLEVFTHENRPRVAASASKYSDETAPEGSPFRPLHDDKILYSGQPVALVVAQEFEIARYAASLVRVEYERADHVTDLREVRDEAYAPKRKPAGPRGNADKAFAKAAVKFEGEYSSPIEHHNPMEMQASTAIWESDGKITVNDKTQGAQNSRNYIVNVFGLDEEDVRVLAPYVGGAFGNGLRPQYQVFLAVMAALALERSVRVVLTRQQMFTFGYRPGTIQTLALGADDEGLLEAIKHEAVAMTSRYEDYRENVVDWSGLLYKCANSKLGYKLAQLDLASPMPMRAPGGALGLYALECAIDELAHKAGVDPLEFRLRNYSDRDQNEDTTYGSKALRECYRQAAERFGWTGRKPQPRAMRDGKELVGWGMATGIWEAMHEEAGARAVLTADGKLEIASATADIGPGTYTMMTQVAADRLGLPMQDVTAVLGDSSLPTAPVEGGSFTAATVGTAVHTACELVRKKLLKLAKRMNSSPLAGAELEDVTFGEGKISRRDDPAQSVSIIEVMRDSGTNRIEEEATASRSKAAEKLSHYAHSAIFAEVKVDEELGVIRVTRVVNAVASGRIINPTIARSQILGGVVWGIGMALHEETLTDHALGRLVNHNIAEYHVPVNADIHDIDVIFVEEEDGVVNPLGVKGVGEIGVVGTAAAIANAIWHATGKRVRDLPITLDKLLA